MVGLVLGMGSLLTSASLHSLFKLLFAAFQPDLNDPALSPRKQFPSPSLSSGEGNVLDRGAVWASLEHKLQLLDLMAYWCASVSPDYPNHPNHPHRSASSGLSDDVHNQNNHSSGVM